MKSYDLITPEGTRDLLFDECVARKEAEDKSYVSVIPFEN